MRKLTKNLLSLGSAEDVRSLPRGPDVPRARRQGTSRLKWAGLALLLTTTLGAGVAEAGIAYTGGIGATSYGVTGYGGGPALRPVFIPNNVTGFNDVMASPGGLFQTANPVVANNISETGLQVLPLGSFWVGGGNGNGAFGAGATYIGGPGTAFTLSDSGPGGGSASYAISSWTANFTTNAGGFRGNLGTYLAIGGLLPFVDDAVAAALVSNYYLNGVYQGQLRPEILAAAGNGNFVALGGSGAALQFGPGDASFRALAIDLLPAVLPAGDNIRVVSTLTEIADPASLFGFDPVSDPALLAATGTTLPDFVLADTVPEPSSLALLGAGVLGLALLSRLRREIKG